MIKPFTDILNPGPISSGRFENRALRATAFEFMEDKREVRREIPSPVEDGAEAPEIGAGASGSEGEAL